MVEPYLATYQYLKPFYRESTYLTHALRILTESPHKPLPTTACLTVYARGYLAGFRTALSSLCRPRPVTTGRTREDGCMAEDLPRGDSDLRSGDTIGRAATGPKSLSNMTLSLASTRLIELPSPKRPNLDGGMSDRLSSSIATLHTATAAG